MSQWGQEQESPAQEEELVARWEETSEVKKAAGLLVQHRCCSR